MRQSWKKIGRIFEPQNFALSYAALPIAQRLQGERYRIFFSSRDHNNRSETRSVVTDLGKPGYVDTPPELVLAPGEAGYFDDAGAMGCCLALEGEKQYLYYVGWNKS